MSLRRLSKLLFGSADEAADPPRPTSVFVERSWNDYQAGKVGNVVAALPGLLQTAQALEDADGVSPLFVSSAGRCHPARTILPRRPWPRSANPTCRGSLLKAPCKRPTSRRTPSYSRQRRGPELTLCSPTAGSQTRSTSHTPRPSGCSPESANTILSDQLARNDLPTSRRRRRAPPGPRDVRRARRAFRRLLEERDKGIVRKPGNPWTVERWLTHWVENIAPLTCRYKTMRGYRTAAYRHLIPGLGAHKLHKIEPEHFEKLYAKMILPV